MIARRYRLQSIISLKLSITAPVYKAVNNIFILLLAGVFSSKSINKLKKWYKMPLSA
jgi:dipeptide/tripeptide permease